MRDIMEKTIVQRERFLKKIVCFAESITRERGKTLKNEVHSAHTHIVRELRGFGGFNFRADMGKTMFGGNTVVISMNDGSSVRQLLSVSWQVDIEHCHVDQIDGQADWQMQLMQVIRRRKSIGNAIDKAKAARAKSETAGAARTQRTQQLNRRAVELRIR